MNNITSIKLIDKINTNNKFTFIVSNGHQQEIYKYRLVTGYNCFYGYCEYNNHIENGIIFRTLGILDPNKFVSNIVGYQTFGFWPEVRSRNDFQKILNALVNYLEL